ncbi:hypothetical protein RF11_00838 [Thelohanellus kitauei]|uniref:BZIP domain-containing protein n=1 Tax=Thelohanellus kitauei TaxID=669202 RepID=A0A0C2N3X7_THEKT|nr:hypothetical protein RF11_00838 [Thelohanellus kitauei]
MNKSDKIDSPESSPSKGFVKKIKYSNNQVYADTGRVYRSRRSARECRQRKKARYKKLDDAIMIKESENLEIIRKIERLQQFATLLDNGGTIPPNELETIRNDLHLLPNILRRYEPNNAQD